MKKIQLNVSGANQRERLTQTKLATQRVQSQENGIAHTSGLYEETLLRAVRTGDYEGLLTTIQTPVMGEMGILSQDPERNARYLFVVTLTLVTREAMRAGVDAETAYQLSDSFCQQMDAGDVLDLEPLTLNMLQEFCRHVRAARGWENYSALISECCAYIARNLHKKISLSDLSAFCGLSERRLSQRFRQETGLSPVTYIHRRKLEEACHLLLHSPYSISQISSLLDYGSQSYFTELFKKEYCCTPKKYRKSGGKHL